MMNGTLQRKEPTKNVKIHLFIAIELPHISDGQCNIANNGDGTIRISGSTSTYYAVGQIGLKLSLQCYSGGKWSTLNNYDYNNYSSAYVYGGKVIGVSSGYNYRVITQHTSLDGGISESGQSYSDAIYIQ